MRRFGKHSPGLGLDQGQHVANADVIFILGPLFLGQLTLVALGGKLIDSGLNRWLGLKLSQCARRFRGQSFDERFKRLWEYYLCYCEAGFEEGSINVGLYTLKHADG